MIMKTFITILCIFSVISVAFAIEVPLIVEGDYSGSYKVSQKMTISDKMKKQLPKENMEMLNDMQNETLEGKIKINIKKKETDKDKNIDTWEIIVQDITKKQDIKLNLINKNNVLSLAPMDNDPSLMTLNSIILLTCNNLFPVGLKVDIDKEKKYKLLKFDQAKYNVFEINNVNIIKGTNKIIIEGNNENCFKNVNLKMPIQKIKFDAEMETINNKLQLATYKMTHVNSSPILKLTTSFNLKKIK